MHNFHAPGDSLRWAELVELLHGKIDALAEVFAARVLEIPEYADNQLGPGDLEATARETFRRLVDGLRGRKQHRLPGDEAGPEPEMESLLGFAADLGAKRARAGIPPEALISAVRLDFSIIWECLLQIADARDAALLASRVDRVWRVVDEFATRTHTSYLTERVRMAQEESSIRREFIARLFNQSSPSAETVSQVAAALGVDAAAHFGLAAASGAAAVALRKAAAGPGSGPGHRSRFFVHEFGGNTYAFWPLAAHRDPPRPRHARRADGRPVWLRSGGRRAAGPAGRGPHGREPRLAAAAHGLRVRSPPRQPGHGWPNNSWTTPASTCWRTWTRRCPRAAAGNGSAWKRRSGTTFRPEASRPRRSSCSATATRSSTGSAGSRS